MPNQSPAAPADFAPKERELVQATLLERYGRAVPLQTVEVDLQIRPDSHQPTACAALYWQDGEAEFVIARVVDAVPGTTTYRTQFFYDDGEAFGTGHSDFGNLGDCVITVLQVQAAHAAERGKQATGPRAPQPAITGDDEYTGPLVI